MRKVFIVSRTSHYAPADDFLDATEKELGKYGLLDWLPFSQLIGVDGDAGVNEAEN